MANSLIKYFNMRKLDFSVTGKGKGKGGVEGEGEHEGGEG